MSNKQSKCVFCNQTTYGRSCPWSHFKNKLHVHTDDPSKCSFCGSSVKIGPGCAFSPSGKHMAGANFFNGMVAESFIMGYVMNKLTEKVYESQAFKMGLIDESGNMLKKPENMEEKLAFSSVDAYVLKLKKLLGNKIDLLNTSIYLEKAVETSTVPIELYEKEVKFKAEMNTWVTHFFEMAERAYNDNLPTPVIEKIILEAFQ